MKIKSTKIKGVKLIYPKVIKDKRGYFVEKYNLKKLKKFFSGNFVQENISLSIQKNTFRGLHFQKNKFSQDKLLSVTKGEIVDYIFDLRFKSKTYGKLLKLKINEKSLFLLFIPKGCAHGFLTLKKNTIINYKVSSFYSKANNSGINYQGIIKNFNKKFVISNNDKKLNLFKKSRKYF
jgi:dTDP-4-dehydrorhamnose 3,5-epimerase